MKKRFFGLLLALYSAAALSQTTFYHCMKNGKKIISNQPCEEQGAKETKRVDSKDLPPLTTMQGMSQEERRRTVQGWQDQREAEERQRQTTIVESNQKNHEKEQRCESLWKQKQDIVAQQRRKNYRWQMDDLNKRHREVNDEMFQLRCGGLSK